MENIEDRERRTDASLPPNADSLAPSFLLATFILKHSGKATVRVLESWSLESSICRGPTESSELGLPC